MSRRPPSTSGVERDNSTVRHGQASNATPRRGSDRTAEASEASLPPSSAEPAEARQPVAKPPTTRLSQADLADGQSSSLRHTLLHLYSSSNSRTPSTTTSSSSLQALNEDTVVDARSDHNVGRIPISRRTSSHNQAGLFDPSSNDYPVYPDQSYAVLQSQVHPTYRPPLLWSRNSYPTQTDPRPHFSPSRPSRTAGNTPDSSPGLFSLRGSPRIPAIASDDEGRIGSPYLHPTHLQPPKETHTAEVDRDQVTGNKVINQYEILEELGRGEHGKVKLGRHVTTRQQVAVKIVQRYSKKRRLGKLGNPEDKVKKEVAILKKARHPNVVSLLEVIDDPNRQKVYIVLEYVENGEIIWRRKGLREIVHVDKLRFEREKAGIPDTPAFLEESRQYLRTAQALRIQREKARERRQEQAAYARENAIPAWSLEHGAESDEDEDELGPELSIARTSSRSLMNHDDFQHSPNHSYASNQDSALAAIEGSMYGAYTDYPLDRRFSTVSSGIGYAPSEPEWFSDDDDMSYVPCLTMNQARNAFRDSVLGLEYLHYQGIIHRDIKPANLLVTSSHRIKISDFGVSYLGRPIRDEEEEQVTETDATELDDARELSKTVGTPAFYAPELCYTGDDFVNSIGTIPKITGAIDVWSLGVTLYGMIFGRLPFMSDDEYSMFQTIVKKEVFIPRKRLQPVEDDPSTVSQWPRTPNSYKRSDGDLVYEEIDDELYDLLKRLLTKDPVKRITLKEIKHHPWVLHGLPNPRTWVEETDPSYQSKGKRIEVSNEEVTTAVSKVPFIQRVRSNVAKWSNYLTGRSKDKDHRKRTPSVATSVESSWDSRRGSLKEEDLARTSRHNSEHPLSQSVAASPVGRDEQTSYFAPGPRSESGLPSDRTPRPGMPERGLSAMSTAESAKTVRASGPETTAHPRTGSAMLGGSIRSSNFGGFLGGASRRLARGFQTGDWRSERSVSADPTSAGESGRSEPSLALSVASAIGQMQNADLLRGQDSRRHAESSASHHRRGRSQQIERSKPSAEPLHLTTEALLRQRRNGSDTMAQEKSVAAGAENESLPNDPLVLRQVAPPGACRQAGSPGGLTTSPPSAATISSSSVDDSASGISQSASHPSIPSVVSGASSLCGDGISGPLREKDKEPEISTQVPSILRTGETVKARRPSSSQWSQTQVRHYCDTEDSSSEDEGLMIGKKKPGNHDPKT